ncbi:MAG TPA: XRE family transcriptional regulator [Gemmatimonadaceae bacterium]
MTNISKAYGETVNMGKAADKSAGSARRNFKELRAKMSPERRARNAAATKAMLAELPLQELRHARELTQAALAETMECGQDEISRLERRADMLVSTLRRYVEAMGGRLDIVATFRDGEVRIANLGELATSES